jgi:hypothetical protein
LCLKKDCGRSYKLNENKSLLRHYKWYPGHSEPSIPPRTRTASITNAKDETKKLLDVGEQNRVARIKELLKNLKKNK